MTGKPTWPIPFRVRCRLAPQTEVRIENANSEFGMGARELGSPFSILNSLFAIRTLGFLPRRLLSPRHLLRNRPTHRLGEPGDRRAEALAVRARQSVHLARQQRVDALAVLLGQALQRGDDVARQPRREPARPNPCRQDERRFPPQRLLSHIDRPDMHGLLRQLRQLVNVDHRPAAALRRLDLAVLDRGSNLAADLPSGRALITCIHGSGSGAKDRRPRSAHCVKL